MSLWYKTNINTISWDIFWEASLLVEFMEQSAFIHAASYCGTSKKLRQNKWCGMLAKSVCLLYDNACLYTIQATQELKGSFRWDVLSHPPHRPDLELSDYHFSTKVKNHLSEMLCSVMGRWEMMWKLGCRRGVQYCYTKSCPETAGVQDWNLGRTMLKNSVSPLHSLLGL